MFLMTFEKCMFNFLNLLYINKQNICEIYRPLWSLSGFFLKNRIIFCVFYLFVLYFQVLYMNKFLSSELRKKSNWVCWPLNCFFNPKHYKNGQFSTVDNWHKWQENPESAMRGILSIFIIYLIFFGLKQLKNVPNNIIFAHTYTNAENFTEVKHTKNIKFINSWHDLK